MKLLTKALQKQIPPLYSTEDVPLGDKMVVAKFFDPCGSYTLYIIELSEEEDDTLLWGLTTGLYEDEFGYTSLNEISAYKGKLGLGIERDLHWAPTKIKDIRGIKRSVWDFRCEED